MFLGLINVTEVLNIIGDPNLSSWIEPQVKEAQISKWIYIDAIYVILSDNLFS